MAISELQAVTGIGTRMVLDDGREFILSPFDLNDWAQIEARWGSLEAFEADPRLITTTRFMLWLSVRHAHPELDEEAAGALMSGNDLDRIEEVLQAFIPATKDSGRGNAPGAAGQVEGVTGGA